MKKWKKSGRIGLQGAWVALPIKRPKQKDEEKKQDRMKKNRTLCRRSQEAARGDKRCIGGQGSARAPTYPINPAAGPAENG